MPELSTPRGPGQKTLRLAFYASKRQNTAMWWTKKSKGAESLLEEHVKRLWDMQARLTALEDRFEASLEELAKRYRRAEQSERDRKKREVAQGTLDPGPALAAPPRHPAIVDLLSRRTAHASDRTNTGTG